MKIKRKNTLYSSNFFKFGLNLNFEFAVHFSGTESQKMYRRGHLSWFHKLDVLRRKTVEPWSHKFGAGCAAHDPDVQHRERNQQSRTNTNFCY